MKSIFKIINLFVNQIVMCKAEKGENHLRREDEAGMREGRGIGSWYRMALPADGRLVASSVRGGQAMPSGG